MHYNVVIHLMKECILLWVWVYFKVYVVLAVSFEHILLADFKMIMIIGRQHYTDRKVQKDWDLALLEQSNTLIEQSLHS